MVYRLEPWGEERADMRMARQTCAIYQQQVKKRLDERDYLFKFHQDRRPANPEEYRRKALRAWGGASGGLNLAHDSPKANQDN